MPRTALSSSDIKAQARAIGFEACGIGPATDLPELSFFPEWIARGYAGSMGYLGRSASLRADVRNLLPSARSVIVTATLYNTDQPYSTECPDSSRTHVARYAWGDDYHDIVGERLHALLAWMREASPDAFEARSYVDTGPVQERVYAQHAGIGWIGKNTCVINPELGSWVFLGEIICSLPLEIDAPALDQCGTCSLCLEACPTHALVSPGVLDSNRCISYLTIEHRGEIPNALRQGIGMRVYGCDVCQEVCPWNALAPTSEDLHWKPRAAWETPRVSDLSALSREDLTRELHGSSMKRAKVEGLLRNIAVVADNFRMSEGVRKSSGNREEPETLRQAPG